jgi:glycogen synthase
MAELLHIIMPTDVFPPVSGGSGWSAHALALALQARGHRVTAIVPRAVNGGLIPSRISRLQPSLTQDRLGVPTIEVPYVTARLPFLANWYRHEWFWPCLRNVIVREALRSDRAYALIHAQHVQSIPAGIQASAELGIPAVATVRDHWPRDYFATGLHSDRLPYPGNTPASLATDLVARLGPTRGVAAWGAIPYMLRHLRRRQQSLARADAVVAVSHYIARSLPAVVPAERVHVIPNIVDIDAVRQVVTTDGSADRGRPFLLYVGKLERNKGAHLLPEILAAARAALHGEELPELVLAGNGALADDLRQQLAHGGFATRWLEGWTDHDDVLRLMHRAEVLLYPSAWGEPLTRVLLEACAAGACIAAMPTGGTPEIIDDGINGLLAVDAEHLGQALARLLRDSRLRATLRAGASETARLRWAPEVVVGRFEALYHEVLST